MKIRKNVWELGNDWADPILWYARGVAAMKARTLAEPTSWNFYGAIHGFDKSLWEKLGYLNLTEPMPTPTNQKRFWEQCQHSSWYFLPWHRGFVLAFEANIRAAVIKLGGPADWALPYWNYFKSNQSMLPPAFASKNWPDEKSNPNPLFVPQRYGPAHDGNVYVHLVPVNFQAMDDNNFASVPNITGFGGLDTGFNHNGGPSGGIEGQVHNIVHNQVGGKDGKNGPFGLMTDPDTAGLDPIFWLHHANIDRLWEVWQQNPRTHVNPTDPNWVIGPSSVGERIFSMPMPDDSPWDYSPGEMTDLAVLDYNYDDLSPAVPPKPLSHRLMRLGASPVAASALEGIIFMPSEKNVELVGANARPLAITGSDVSTSVQLDAGVRRKVSASLNKVALAAAPAPSPQAVEPDRIFLNLENIRGLAGEAILDVYVGLPDGANPADHPERLAGSAALFGLRKASIPDEEHAGQGLTFVLEITTIIDALHLNNALDVDALNVRIVPRMPVPDEANVSIGRVSVFRQGGEA